MALEIGSSGTKIIMKTKSKLRLACFALVLLAFAAPSRAETEKRIAFVVGNAAYAASPLATTANDAGLIAQTLQAAGFDVSGARDLDGEALRAAFRDFLDKAQASGPDTVAFVYLAGYGLQLDGENYFVPVDAKIASAPDVAVEALRVFDYAKRLAGLPLKASFIVLDAAREQPFAKSGPPLAGGLALADAEPNMLLAFSATPGTVAPTESGPYGAYARALTEMIREGGLQPSDLFDGVRLRVNEETKGALVPWDASRIAAPFVFFDRAPDAPPPALAPDRVDAMRSQPLRDLGAQDAYAAAIERDTLQGYEDFLAAYPDEPLANRIRALLAARREAVTWRHTCRVGTPDAYWSYLNRYPRGPHAADAHWRLESLAAASEPPPSFVPMVYDVPPPPPAEIVNDERPKLVYSDPVFGFLPPPPIVILAPTPAYLVFPPPPPPEGLFILPVPVFVPVPVWINPPVYVAPPPENVIFNNIHNTTVINNNGSVINPGAAGVGAGVAAGVAAGAIAARVALPPSVARRATLIGDQGAPGIKPGQPVPGALPATRWAAGHELTGAPGANGKPLPGFGQKSGTPAAQLPAGQALPGAKGTPLPGPVAKPGTPPVGQPGAAPPTRLPTGQAQPGAKGTPLPVPGQNPGVPQNPPRKKPPAAHALPSGQGLTPATSGNGAPKGAKPGPVTPSGALPAAGQKPLNRRPTGQLPPQIHVAPPGANGRPVVTGPGPAMMPKPPQTPQRPPQQFQQGRPPQPAFQQPRAPQQVQQPRQPAPPKQQPKCGLPGLPPCR
jgi:uncharacterized caspase-like protein